MLGMLCSGVAGVLYERTSRSRLTKMTTGQVTCPLTSAAARKRRGQSKKRRVTKKAPAKANEKGSEGHN